MNKSYAPRWETKITDPYQTLSGINIYSCAKDDGGDSTIIGFYRNNSIIWDSGPVILGDISSSIKFCKDINKDGKVEIGMVSEFFPDGWSRFAEPDTYLWILSWDGSNCTIINDYDENTGKSKITPGPYYLFDNEGDGIYEISSQIFNIDRIEENQDTTANVLYKVYGSSEYVTFGWNGTKYGLWASVYQLQEGDFYPAVWFTPEINCNVSNLDNQLKFQYIIGNDGNSQQTIYEFYISNIAVNSVDADSESGNGFEAALFDNMWLFSASSPSTLIPPGKTVGDFWYIGEGLPGVSKSYLRGLIPPELARGISDESMRESVYDNSVIKTTIGLKGIPDNIEPKSYVDTLIYYTTQSYELHWIENEGIFNSLTVKLENAKDHLANDRNGQAANVLNAITNEVEAQNGNQLTSEAYALLYYNAEYLIEQIPVDMGINITSISPQITITKTKTKDFTLTVYGSNFTKKSDVYFKGKKKKTKFISENELEAEIKDKDFKKEGTYRVHVSEKKVGRTDELEFNVYKELPERLIPVLNCIEEVEGKTNIAWFGYENYNDGIVFIDGKENEIKGGKKKKGGKGGKKGDNDETLVIFLPGVHEKVFSVEYDDKKDLKWELLKEKAEVTEETPVCQ
jgi:hypothetical protein